MIKGILLTALLLIGSVLSAQRFGGTPPEIKWKQINTDSARIIFPAGLDSQAQRIAALVHRQAIENPVPLGERLQKINIVLQNQTVVSNGYVGLGPYRSEFYLTPPPNNFEQGSIGWADGLAIHEYRHVQQFNNFRHGISDVMRVLFGQEGYALAINASVPDWFYEGDAVYNESVLSSQGRGRLPLFLNAYPALWKAGKKYSWAKLRNGSMKDYVPSHYHLGYLLVNYGYEKYGINFWRQVTRDASAFRGLLYPFQKAIRSQAGLPYKKFRDNAFDFYKAKENDSPSKSAGEYEQVLPVNKRYVTNTMFPYQVGEDSVLYVKTSYRHRPAFYIRDAKGEHRLRVKDIGVDDQFSYRNGNIVYTGFEKDPRWDWRDYSVIKVFNIYSREHKTITTKSKYFSPDISGSGARIAAIEFSATGKSELHILDAGSGSVNKRIREPGVNVYSDPKFIDENTLVAAVRLKDGKMALVKIDLATDASRFLTEPSYNVVGFPAVHNGMVYYTASYGGSDNIFAVRLDDGRVLRVTSGQPGHYFVNAGTDKIIWSNFTAEGYQLQQMKEPPLLPVDNTLLKELTVKWPVSHSDSIPEILTNTAKREFTTGRYPKSTGLINFHSWRPYYEDPEFTFSLYGQNILNTIETDLYYLYNQNDNTNAVGFGAVFGGWFPQVNAGTQYTFNRRQTVSNRLRQWDQLDTRIGLSIPLNVVKGRTFRNFSVGSSYAYRTDMIKGDSKRDFRNIHFSYLSHVIRYSAQVQSAVQHIFPRLGYALSGQYNHSITENKSWQFLGGVSLYLPGALSTHHMVLTGAWQETDTANAFFGNRFPYSRGFNEAYLSRMWRGSANYHFPLFYPDWGFANILYVKRVRANGFFDFTRVYSNDKTIWADQRSAGGELFLDTKWWNQYELSFGFRVSRLLDEDLFTGTRETIYEFILPVSIFPK